MKRRLICVEKKLIFSLMRINSKNIEGKELVCNPSSHLRTTEKKKKKKVKKHKTVTRVGIH